MRSRHRVKQEDRVSSVLFPISRGGPFKNLTAREWRQDLLLSWLFQTCIRLQTSLNRVFSRHGMTLQEASVLLRCIEAGKIVGVQLALAVGRDRGKITRFVKRLEVAGLVRRAFDPRDKRLLIIQLTADGRRIGEEVASMFRKVRKKLFSGILEKDAERLGKMLLRLHKNAAHLSSGRFATGKPIRRRIGNRRLKAQQAKVRDAWVQGDAVSAVRGKAASSIPPAVRAERGAAALLGKKQVVVDRLREDAQGGLAKSGSVAEEPREKERMGIGAGS
jgi:DNA-binding MarR family transcriptional regulator